MQIPKGWKKRQSTMWSVGAESIGFIKLIHRGTYVDEFHVDITKLGFKQSIWRVDTSGSITSAKRKEFKTKPAAMNYAIKIMKYVNYGQSLGVLN